MGIGLLWLASAADASPVVSLRWSGTTGVFPPEGNQIEVSNTSVTTLTLDLILADDGDGIPVFVLSLRFDTDGSNELNVLSFAEDSWSSASGMRKLSPINPGIQSTQESLTGGPEGQLFGFEGITLGGGLKNASFVFGRVVFETNPGDVRCCGEISVGLFSGFDEIFSDAGTDLAGVTTFGGALVFAPEPGVLALLGVGVGGLLWAGRSRRS